jgi:uncharacterized protein YijF (DUF1287 family)
MRSLNLAIFWLFAGVPAFADVAAPPGLDLARSARQQIGVTTSYDPAYQRIPFPNGDLPRSTGVCTDVVIRALRDARRLDLQREVNADMKANWDAYPRRWQQLHRKPDPNIDHRRVPNLMTFFQRRGYALPLSKDPAKYIAGDIVAWDLGRGILHIGVVSDSRPFNGIPTIIHNIGRGTVDEDILFRFKIIGHYRYPVVTRPNPSGERAP